MARGGKGVALRAPLGYHGLFGPRGRVGIEGPFGAVGLFGQGGSGGGRSTSLDWRTGLVEFFKNST